MFTRSVFRRLAVACVPLVLCVSQVAAEGPKPRLALCASGHEKAEAIAALMEVELSRRSELVLLDRREVGKVLAEHELSLRGLLSPDDALKVGELLGCDVFAEVHCDEAAKTNAEVTSLVAFDALTGVRLYDGALPGDEELDRRAAAAVEAMALGLAKWQGGGTVPDCRTLSLVSIRQLDLPVALLHVPETLGLLLKRRLVNSPDIAILERQRLQRIDQEVKLTALRRDRLLASSVVVDLDVSHRPQKGSLGVRAVLTDGAGKRLGSVEASGSASDLERLVTRLANAIVDKLKRKPLAESSIAQGFEADRFLADAIRLELRGHKEQAAGCETAASVLAEAAIEKTPSTVSVQKLICRLLRRKAARTPDPWQTVALLERHVGLSENWLCGPDSPWFTDGFAELLHATVKRLGHVAGAERMTKLRGRFGRWCRTMAEQDPACVGDLQCVEAWSTTAEGMLEDAGEYLPTLPEGFGVGRYSATTDYSPVAAGAYLYQIESFSAAEKRKLLSLYEGWARGSEDHVPRRKTAEGLPASARHDLFRRMHSAVCAAMLVNDFPKELGNQEDLVDQYLRQAAELVLDDRSLSGRLLALCEARGRRPPSFYRPLPCPAIVEHSLWLAEALDRDRVACPLLLEYLDEHDADRADFPGAYLRQAWAQIDCPDYTQPGGDVLVPRYAEWYEERIRQSYHSRYGGEVVPTGPAEIEEAPLESMTRVFDFESIPGVSSIESAELAGHCVYLLCLHTDPRSYELRRVDLRSGKEETLGEVVTDRQYRARTGNEICIGSKAVYVPTSEGLICFSRDSRDTWIIDGLPAARVTACLEARGKLYLGCSGREEGYLLECNPDGIEQSVLACSGRKEKQSGLDDCPPYTVDSMIYDATSERIFVAAMFLEPEASDRPWLWAYDLKSRRLSEVHQRPYHPLQLRLLPDGQCVFQLADMHTHRTVTRTLSGGTKVKVRVRAPSADGARGYGLWDPATYPGEPLETMQDHLVPLIGNTEPEKLRIHYRVPTFCGRHHVMPGTAGSLALIGRHYLVSSAVRRTPLALDPPAEPFMINARAGYGKPWQLIPRDDTGAATMSLPPLDDEAPFMVREYDEGILACTQGGVWLVRPKLERWEEPPPGAEAPGADVAREVSAPSAVGSLIVRAPLGARVRLDQGETYRVWNGGRLTWNRLPVGRHKVSIEFHDRKAEHTVDVKPDKAVTLTASFGEEAAEARSLDLGGGCRLRLVWIPPDRSEESAKMNLSFDDGFWMGQYEVTQRQYEAVMGGNPSAYRDATHPVENVGRNEARRFCRRLTEKCGGQLDGLIARLPSSHEWTYACRAGTTTLFNTGDTQDDLLKAAWTPQSSGGRPHPVGLKMGNRFWLHDMHGNVAEWCERGETHGGSWRADRGSPSEAAGFRILVTKPDGQLGRDPQGWLHLSYVDPIHAKIGWGTFVRYKDRDTKPGIGGTTFHTVMYVHANSSIKYKLDGKYTQFTANYGLWTGAHGVCQFVVLADGKERFRSGYTWGLGGTSTIGVKNPVQLDITGVDVLELRAVQAGNKPLANACGLWGDAKIK